MLGIASITLFCHSHQLFFSSLSEPEAVEQMLANLYTLRSFSLWKDPAHCSWLGETVTNLFTSAARELPASARRRHFLDFYFSLSPRYSVYRHVIVLGDSVRRLSSFMPAEVLRVKMLNCDPLPPPTSVTQYDEEFFGGVEDLFGPQSRQDRAADMRLLGRLVPDALLRGQLQVTKDNFPQLLLLLISAWVSCFRHFSMRTRLLRKGFQEELFSLRKLQRNFRRMSSRI
jgi:hypothetical protein